LKVPLTGGMMSDNRKVKDLTVDELKAILIDIVTMADFHKEQRRVDSAKGLQSKLTPHQDPFHGRPWPFSKEIL
jgi:hypothetical protein